MSQDWSQDEVHPIILDYFHMLQQELKGLPYNKTEHRKALFPKLNHRTEGSIEFKHQNISAVLVNLGRPFIRGYKPKFNYQQILEEEVINYLHQQQFQLDPLFESFSNEEALQTSLYPAIDLLSCLEEAPPPFELKTKVVKYQAVKIDYLEKEQNNRKLGIQGEQFVMDYEKWRLKEEGRADLIGKIKWVSNEEGDGLGYDILSKNSNGSDRYIEVKTTKLSKETPIYFSEKELSFASDNTEDFYLYRVFNIDNKPKLFIKKGEYGSFCHLIPVKYKGIF